MANSNLTPTVVTKEIGRILHNNLVFCRNINRQYDNSNTMGGQKNGGSIKVRLPNKYTTSTGAALSVQDNVEQSVTIPSSTQRHVDINFTTQELTQDIDNFSKRILEPAASVLASMVDYDAMSLYQGIGNSVGTPGTTPATALALLNAHKYMDYFATPRSQRYATVNPDANASLVDGLKGLFNAQGTISENYKMGSMANNQLGFQEIAMSQSVRTHTTGAFAGSVLVNEGSGVTEGDSVLSLDAFTDAAPTVKAGDVFTVAGVYSVNPETKESTGQLQQFVVTADKTGSTNAIADVAVSPAMYAGSGGLQNISALPADGAAITFVGSASTAYPQNIAYHKDAFILATTDLEMPEGVHFSAREVMDGLSMRLVRQYRIGTDDIPCRVDMLYAYVTAREQMATRIWG